jgi:hypothetical protein
MNRAAPPSFLVWLSAVLLFAAAPYCAYASLPFWRFYLIGAPTPGTSPRYLGEVSLVGNIKYSRRGKAIPPRYILTTASGTIELKCGFWPNRSLCPISESRAGEIYEIGFDEYWGIDYIKYPPVRGEVYIWTGDKVDEFRARYARQHFYYFLISLLLVACGALRMLFWPSKNQM